MILLSQVRSLRDLLSFPEMAKLPNPERARIARSPAALTAPKKGSCDFLVGQGGRWPSATTSVNSSCYRHEM